MGSQKPGCRPVCYAAWLISSWLCFVALSCAKSEEPPLPVPPVDASSDDASFEEADSSIAQDVSIDEAQAKETTPEATPDNEVDVAEEPLDYCALEGGYEASEGPCTPNTMQKEWCGLCGHRQRTCTPQGTWKPWTECFEDETAECRACEAHTIGCGFCGTQTQRCDISQGVCQWVLSACEAKGACSPGDYELESSGCTQGLAHLRWCQAGCAWGEQGPCETPPSFAAIDSSPLAARSGSASVPIPNGWFLWGGVGEAGALKDGAVFDPATNSWKPVAPAQWTVSDPDAGDSGVQELSARAHLVALWTGTEVLLWGGETQDSSEVLGDGALWNPSGVWRAVSTTNALSKRSGATAVWDPVHKIALVWGGKNAYGSAAKGGARYNPSTDIWTPLSAAPFDARQGHSAVWDTKNNRMIVWGGIADASTAPERSGAQYDPETDTWLPLAEAPLRRKGQVAFWDEAQGKMLVLFGDDGVWGNDRSDGAAWDAATNSWSMISDLSLSGFPIARGYAATFGAGKVWVLGGQGAGDGKQTGRGARYDPSTDSWAKLPELATARTGHACAWFNQLVVWSGQGPQNAWLSSGERLAPLP